MVYASAILHNMFTVHKDDSVDFSVGTSAEWRKFHDSYKQGLRCPTCVRRNVAHCIHQAGFRVGFPQVARARKAPSDLRDELCERLWCSITEGDVAPVTEDDVDGSDAQGAHVQAEVERVRATINQMHIRAAQSDISKSAGCVL